MRERERGAGGWASESRLVVVSGNTLKMGGATVRKRRQELVKDQSPYSSCPIYFLYYYYIKSSG